MTIRLAELQVALPKTQDVNKIVEQMQQRGQHMQEHISAERKKEEIQKRHRVSQATKKDGASLHLHTSSNQEGNHYQKKKEQHPFKGNSIDISG